MTAAQVLLPIGLGLGEGVIGSGVGDEFVFVDINTARVFRGSLGGKVNTIFTGTGSIGAVAPTRSGDLLIAERRGLRLLSGVASAELPRADADIRTNDGKADPRGRFLIGTMADPPRPGAGALWSFGEQGASVLARDVTISNGLCWSADGSQLYYIDTPTNRVDVFDYDVETGEAMDRRRLVDIDPEYGAPDGMTIDDDGALWVALWGGGAVHRYVGSALDDVVTVPTRFVTCPTFVDDQLVITTAADPAPDDRMAGHVYVAAVDGGRSGGHLVDEGVVFST